VAHIINLIINDIISILKLKAAPGDEIAIFINNMEKLAKKKGSKTVPDEPGKIFLFLKKIFINYFINFYRFA